MSAYMRLGNRYEAERRHGHVTVTINRASLCPRYDLVKYTDDGFDWGCIGNSTKQLAIAMLAWELPEQQAIDHHEKYACDVLGIIDSDAWVISGLAIHNWLLSTVYDQPPIYTLASISA